MTCEAIECASPADVKIRPNVFDLTEGQIKSLRRGVAVMKARAESNPTSWIAQANLHADPAIREPVPTWCQHSSWFFFPWHRMYLYWFEQILRDASDDPDLMLPYWNYTDNPEHRSLPDAVRARVDADGNPNPLFEQRRNQFINQGWGMPASSVDIARSFGRTNFSHEPGDPRRTSFGGARWSEPAWIRQGRDNMGSLEGVPHGQVHNQVGGPPASFSHTFNTIGTFPYRADQNPEMEGEVIVVDTGVNPGTVPITITDFGFGPSSVQVPPGTIVTWNNEGVFPHAIGSLDGTTFNSGTLAGVNFMRSLLVSARDPIFWMHHANIDRLWNRWLEPGVGGVPETETEWLDQHFSFFKPNGEPAKMCVRDVLSVYCLGYRYDDDPETEPTPIIAVTARALATPAAGTEPRISALGENEQDAMIELGGERLTTMIELDPPAEAELTRIAMSEATPVADAADPRIALTLEGLRDTGSPGVTYEVYVNLPPDAEPDYRSEYFVGLIDLFGLTAHEDHRSADRQSFDITPTVRSLQERGEWPGELTITFVPQGLIPPEGAADAPIADARQALTRATPGSWVTIERVTVVAIE
jgi:plastocyanin